jgi:signal transduction histidine kinase/phage shock protein PspC (stress-responsive transcriptional regulator)
MTRKAGMATEAPHPHRKLTQNAPPSGGLLGFGLHRSQTHRLVAGVAGGLGERLGIDPALLRIAFVLLSLSGGLGLLVYLVLWAIVPEDDGRAVEMEPGLTRGLSLGLIVAGLMLGLAEFGLWFGSTLAISTGLAALGVGTVWLRTDASERDRLRGLATRFPERPLEAVAPGMLGKARLVVGGLLLSAGIATFLARTDALRAAPAVVFAVAVTILGLGIVVGPWGWRLARQLTEERRDRIRSEERAEMAAHLHDSVLQTLALIQRTDEPREMLTLARTQERELRAWLNGTALSREGSLIGAVEDAAAAVELQFKLPVEVVGVGDAPIDDRLIALVEACREAMVNAARHSGADSVAVYVEVEHDRVTAFVRDEGKGFDSVQSGTDRRGIAESIRGRMARSGGTATVSSEVGAGTEVQLSMPRSR